MRLLLSLCLTALLATAFAASKSYTGYKVIQTRPLVEKDVGKLSHLVHRPEFSFWSQPRVGRPADIMTDPEHTLVLARILRHLGLNPTTIVEDVGEVERIEREQIEKTKAAKAKPGNKAVTFDTFMNYDEIQEYLDELVASYPELATIIEIGQSTEGRPLRVLKISNGPGKKALFTDAAIHAREWITPPVILKIAFELLENYQDNKALVDMVDWYILPVANPDGYVYSWESDRYWRKTRSTNAGSSCIGTDPNRNFDFHWGEEGGTTPCSETWPNTQPFSEPETKAMSDFMIENTDITLYIAMHSYGELLMYPYGHTTDLPPTYDELNQYALEAAAALEAVGGTVYEVGSVANILYYSYGACRDWAYGAAGIPLSYTFELPGYGLGFAPPASAIVPVVAETWEAVKVLASKAPLVERP